MPSPVEATRRNAAHTILAPISPDLRMAKSRWVDGSRSRIRVPRCERSCADAASTQMIPYLPGSSVVWWHRGVWTSQNYWAARLGKLGHECADAAGLCEALRQAWKTDAAMPRRSASGQAPNDVLRRDQVPGAQAARGMHRTRDLFVKQRTQLVNISVAWLAEFGHRDPAGDQAGADGRQAGRCGRYAGHTAAAAR